MFADRQRNRSACTDGKESCDYSLLTSSDSRGWKYPPLPQNRCRLCDNAIRVIRIAWRYDTPGDCFPYASPSITNASG